MSLRRRLVDIIINDFWSRTEYPTVTQEHLIELGRELNTQLGFEIIIPLESLRPDNNEFRFNLYFRLSNDDIDVTELTCYVHPRINIEDYPDLEQQKDIIDRFKFIRG